jgi:hypothetical protein
MKRLVLIALLVVCVAGAANAQLAGSIAVFSDPGGTNCNFVDGGSLVQAYVYHVFHDGATASQFRIVTPGWMWLGDNIAFAAVIGNTNVGISIGYGTCQAAPTYLGSVNYLGTVAAPCSYISVVPDPGALTGEIEGVDCSTPEQKTFPTGGVGIINGDGSCDCNVPVEETTWGGIKSLYQ